MPAVVESLEFLVAKFVARAMPSSPLVATPNGPPNFCIPPPTMAPVFPNFLVKTSVILAPLNMSSTFFLEAAFCTALPPTTVLSAATPSLSPTVFLALASISSADMTRPRLATTASFALITSSALSEVSTRDVANSVACF